MMRLKKLIRNLLITAVLLFLFMRLNGLYFSPERALHASERDLNYGPSRIAHSFDSGNRRILLARYENFISAPGISRSLGVFWHYGGGWGAENRSELPLFFTYYSYGDQRMISGVRNDPVIVRVEAEVRGSAENDFVTLTSSEFYEDMFYIIWEVEDEDALIYNLTGYIRAYDDTGALVYETEY